MLHRHCHIDHAEPVDSGGRGESMGTRRGLTAAVAPNEPNLARVSPGRANPQRRDCRVASLLAMTPARREPVMSNKACAKVSWCNSAGMNPARPKLADRPE